MKTEILITYIHAVGIMALLTMVYGCVARRAWNARAKSVIIGLVFGAGAVVTMAAPFQIQPGIIIDGRTVIIALGSAFGGLPAAIISGTIAATYRYSLGGAGMLPGTLCILIASCLGLIWAQVIRPNVSSPVFRLAILASLSPLSLVAAFSLPWAEALKLLSVMFVPNTISSVVATVILGAFLEKEAASVLSEEKLRAQASIDALTGIENRFEFDRRLARSLSETSSGRSATSLLIIDADHFKSVNDRFGHSVGDAVLRRIAQILTSVLGTQDHAARLGGEEFGVILETRSPNRAAKVAEAIRSAIANEGFEARGDAFRVTVSVGCAVVLEGESVQSLYDRADSALYAAKNSGRNNIRLAPRDKGVALDYGGRYGKSAA